jgi:hypothetical protein
MADNRGFSIAKKSLTWAEHVACMGDMRNSYNTKHGITTVKEQPHLTKCFLCQAFQLHL